MHFPGGWFDVIGVPENDSLNKFNAGHIELEHTLTPFFYGINNDKMSHDLDYKSKCGYGLIYNLKVP